MTLICQGAHCYNVGDWGNWTKLYPWSSLAINISQMIALYCIVSFYMETHDWCHDFRPLGKVRGRAPARARRMLPGR